MFEKSLVAWWGGPPGPRGTPSSRCRGNDISILQGASRPTGASAADRGVRPTKPASSGGSPSGSNPTTETGANGKTNVEEKRTR